MNYVSIQGPESGGIDRRTGDEYPIWTVCVADEDGEPRGRVYTLRSLSGARQLGREMSRDRRLPVADEATAA